MAGAFNPDSMEEFMHAAEASYSRFQTNFDNICAKYGQEFPDTDIVCMKTGEILKDKGTVKKLKPIQFGEVKLAVTKRRTEKLLTTLSQSNLDISGRPADALSVYSNYVTGSANHSHFSDDASKLISFICVKENEPSDAETLSSGDSSDAVEENSPDTSDIDSYFDEIDGDLGAPKISSTGQKHGHERKLKDSDNRVWYSLGSSSDHSDISCRKVFGSINSRSREVFSKNENSDITEGGHVDFGSLSKGNVEKFGLSKQHTEDSGFGSGPGKRLIGDSADSNHVRMFCLNDEKINRVMNWVKDQAKENMHFSPPESLNGQHEASPADEVLLSPTKMRKTLDRDNFGSGVPHIETQSSLIRNLILKPLDSMNKTYCVPAQLDQNDGAKSDKENNTCLIDASNMSPARQMNLSKMNDSTVLLDNPDLLSGDVKNDSGSLTPRRIVRARKRAFTPMQPSYTSEQLLDYFSSPMPKTVIEVLSPSCPRVQQSLTNQNVTVPTPPPTPEKNLHESATNCFEFPRQSEFLQNTQPQIHDKSSLSSSTLCQTDKPKNNLISVIYQSNMNNLNKNVTRESNTSNGDVNVTKVRTEPGFIVENPGTHTNPEYPTRHEPVGRWRHGRISEADDAITLCEGYGTAFQQHDHILSPVPRVVRTPTNSNSTKGADAVHCKSVGFGNKKQIFDRLKKGGCSSDSKVQSGREHERNSVRARRQLSMEQPGERCLLKEMSRKEEGKDNGSISRKNDRRNQLQQEKMELQENRVSREIEASGEQSFLSLDERRIEFFNHQQLSTRILQEEDMDTDCSESSYSQNGTNVFENKRGTPEIGKALQKIQKNDNGTWLVRPLPRSGQRPYCETSHRRGRCPEKALDGSISASPSSSAKQETKTDTILSPVTSRRCWTTAPGQGSPSTALSQLHINSPTHIKPDKPSSHKKSSKEIFSVPCGSSVLQSQKKTSSFKLKPSKESVLSPRKSDDPLKEVVQSPRKSSLLSNKVSHSPKPKDFILDNSVPSPRKTDINIRQSPGKIERSFKDCPAVFKEPKEVRTKSSAFKSVRSSSQSNLSRSSKHVHKLSQSPRKHTGDDCRRFPMPSIDSVTRCKFSHNSPTSSSLVSSKDFQQASSDAAKSRSSQKPVFLVPDQSLFKSLKPIKSAKKKAIEGHTNSLDRQKFTTPTNNNQRFFHHLTEVHSSRWTSTPAKGRSVPILNDTISTIFLGVEDQALSSDEDDEDEVRTVSPYSFQSESVMGN